MERRKPLNVSGSTPCPHFGCICNITQPLGCWWHCLPPKNPILSNAPTSKSLFDLAGADKIRKRSAATCHKHNLYIYQLQVFKSQTMQNSFACKTAKSAFTIHWAPEAASYHVSGPRWGVCTDGRTDWLTVLRETRSLSLPEWVQLRFRSGRLFWGMVMGLHLNQHLQLLLKRRCGATKKHQNSLKFHCRFKNLAVFFAMCW